MSLFHRNSPLILFSKRHLLDQKHIGEGRASIFGKCCDACTLKTRDEVRDGVAEQALTSRMEEPEGQRLGSGTGPSEAMGVVTLGEGGSSDLRGSWLWL